MPILLDNTTAGTVTIKGPATGASTLVFPTSNGTNGQVLTTDGAGNMSWAAAAAGGAPGGQDGGTGLGQPTKLTYTGVDQSYTVPTGVNSVVVKMWGAGGGGGNFNNAGGGGGFSTAIIPVTPGEVLTVKVGQGGQLHTSGAASATYGGGGTGGTGGGASGGGMSAVFRSATPLVIAGGGGGAGWSDTDRGQFGGAGGGTDGQAGAGFSNAFGRPGTSTAGGAGGTATANGTAGSQYQGGNGASYGGSTGGGGGGGGGYYGGGGAGDQTTQASAGGGGGSGYLTGTSATTTAGTGATRGNNADTDQTTIGYGMGGTGGNNANAAGATAGQDGVVVITPGGVATTSSIQFNNGGAFTGSAALVWDAITARLGIGTAYPNQALDVVGNILASGTITGSNLSGTNTGDQTANSILPSQTGNAGRYLVTDGTNVSWGTTAALSSLTDVNIVAPADGHILTYSGNQWVNVMNTSSYTLPIASTTVLGGIKVGSNLAIDANGVLSVTLGSGSGIPGGTANTVNDTGDIHYASVSLLLHCNGTNGSTTFTDTSPTPKTITVNGNAQISTTQSKFGGAAVVFDGSGDYLTTASHVDFAYPADFTVEFWMYPIAWTNNGSWIDATVTGGFAMVNEGTGTWKISRSNQVNVLAGLPLPSLNNWHHIAASRVSGVLRAFVDGTSVGSVSDSSAFIQSGVSISVGSSWSFNGYMDEIRITKGVGRYSANFTPPTAAFFDSVGIIVPTGGSVQWNSNGSFGGDSLFIWDDVNNRLGVNTATPTQSLDVTGNILASGTLTGSNLSGTNTGDQTADGILPSQTGNSGKYLTTNGTTVSWGTVTGGGGGTLDALTDVAITSPVSNQVLAYDGATWINSTYPTTTTTDYTTIVSATHPVRFHRLNETSGSSAADPITGNAATINGGVTLNQTVDGRTMMLFDGTTGYVQTNYSGSPDQFSVECWVKPNTQVASHTGNIISHSEYFAGSFTSFPFVLRVDAAGTTLTASFSLGNDFAADLLLTATISTTAISHVVVTRVAGGLCSLYVNGVLIASNTLAGTLSSYPGNWTIGRASAESGGGIGMSTFAGYIGDVAIYESVLSAADVAAHYSGALTVILNSASPTTLGGIKVGNNLVIDGNGVLSAVLATGVGVPAGTANTQSTGAGDADFNSVTLLLHCDGTNGSAIFTDYSNVQRPITVYGTAQISTAQSKFGGSSLILPGSGVNFITIGGTETNSILNMGVANAAATIEMWAYPLTTSTVGLLDSGSGQTGVLRNYPANVLEIQGASPTISFSLTPNQWSHVAIVLTKPASTVVMKMYVNGSLIGTATTAASTVVESAGFTIGSINSGGAGTFNGYIDDIRITKGIARYTTAFTPPTAAFPNDTGLVATGGSVQWNKNGLFGGDTTLIWDDVNNRLGVNLAVPTESLEVVGNIKATGSVIGSNTTLAGSPGSADSNFSAVSLLLPCDGSDGSTTFTDTSSNAHVVSSVGGATLSAIQSKFGGTSAAFNGTTGYLTIPSSTQFDLGTTYTIEFWIYPNATAATFGILHRGFYNTTGGTWSNLAFSIRHIGAETVRFYFYATQNSNEQYIDVTNCVAVNTWRHVAMVRSGTTGQVFVDGISRGTISALNTPAASTNAMKIGVWDYSAGAEYFNGYLDDIRITKGVVRYTTTFTPPTTTLPGSGVSSIQYNNNAILGGDQLLVWDSISQRLGVNKAIPTETLDVGGNIKTTGTIVGAGISGTTGTFSGAITASSPALETNDTTVATTEWVYDHLRKSNYIINGNFDFWQRATSHTTGGVYGSDDRWRIDNAGSTFINSQQVFTVGQTDVPNNPRFYSRTAVTSVAGVANYCLKQHRIEWVRRLSGKTVTLSFWAKADASKNIAIELLQSFGTGGTPSALVTGIGVTTVALTASWAKYSVTINVPSILGKTLGTDDNDFLSIVFWFDAGSNYASRTNSLGNQSGTFDIAQVQLEEGSIATEFENRPYDVEYLLCCRYYQTYRNVISFTYNTAGGISYDCIIFSSTMRDIPTVTYSSISYTNSSGLTTNLVTPYLLRPSYTMTAAGRGYPLYHLSLDAEI